ncbi:MAG: hypothetical protein ACP5MD_04365, partial [Verrucomicrobiia bacterium]
VQRAFRSSACGARTFTGWVRARMPALPQRVGKGKGAGSAAVSAATTREPIIYEFRSDKSGSPATHGKGFSLVRFRRYQLEGQRQYG